MCVHTHTQIESIFPRFLETLFFCAAGITSLNAGSFMLKIEEKGRETIQTIFIYLFIFTCSHLAKALMVQLWGIKSYQQITF